MSVENLVLSVKRVTTKMANTQTFVWTEDKKGVGTNNTLLSAIFTAVHLLSQAQNKLLIVAICSACVQFHTNAGGFQNVLSGFQAWIKKKFGFKKADFVFVVPTQLAKPQRTFYSFI